MKTVQISLNSIDKVKSFVNEITKYDYDFDLVSGRYVIDAKSINHRSDVIPFTVSHRWNINHRLYTCGFLLSFYCGALIKRCIKK